MIYAASAAIADIALKPPKEDTTHTLGSREVAPEDDRPEEKSHVRAPGIPGEGHQRPSPTRTGGVRGQVLTDQARRQVDEARWYRLEQRQGPRRELRIANKVGQGGCTHALAFVVDADPLG